MIIAGSHSLPVEEIWFDRTTRQRKEITDIEPLAASIAARGLIHPIIVTKDGELIAGERRFTAVKSLGWTHIEARYVDEISPAELQMIELEENIRRQDISWQEQCLAVEKWHALKLAEDPSWTQAKTADELGMSATVTNDRIALAGEIKKDSAIGKIDRLSTAINTLTRQNERKRTAIIAALDGTTKDTVEVPLLNADFIKWSAAYTGPKFNFLHCDFPYGINANAMDQGNNRDVHGTYSDTPDDYFALLSALSAAMENVIAPSAHLMFWFSMNFYEVTRVRLTEMGWKVNPMPLIWYKSDNTGLLPDPQRGPRQIYETAFLASRGDRLIAQPVANTFAHPGKDKTLHMSEKPREMLRHFFRMFVDDSTALLDPTAGSANSLWAAQELRATRVLGLELSPEFHARSVAAWKARKVGEH